VLHPLLLRRLRCCLLAATCAALQWLWWVCGSLRASCCTVLPGCGRYSAGLCQQLLCRCIELR
jgi:hypothetical protein